MVKKYFILIIVIVFVSNIMAQSAWKTFNTENSGIVSNQIYQISTDNQGNKWIGTEFGLCSYNGTTWKTYNSSNSGIPYDIIKFVSVDKDGVKWIGNGGLVKFDGTNWEIYNRSNSGIASDTITCLTIDQNLTKWIGTGNGLNKFDGKNWSTYKTSNSGIVSDDITCITIDSYGNKWIGTKNGLSKYDGNNWTTYNSTNSGIVNSEINCIQIDLQGNLWIGTVNGLSKYDGKKWETYITTNSGLGSNIISYIVIDKLGNKWIGTEYGLNKFDEINWFKYNTANSGISNDKINFISIDLNGDKWLSTSNGISILIGNGNSTLCSNQNEILTKTNKFCKNSSVTLYSKNQKNNYKYLWKDEKGNIISDSSKVTVLNKGNYFLKIEDSCCYVNNDILVSISDTVINQPSICMVTTQNNNNLIIWENIDNNYISKYRIYKQNQITSNYELVHEKSKHEISEWLDTLSKSNTNIDRYKLSIVDSCDKETNLSNNHTTILLSSNMGLNGTVNLSWNPYEGFEYQNFEIWRSYEGSNFIKISSVANNSYAYVDNNPPPTAWYQIRISKQNFCNATKRSVSSVHSNIISKDGKSLNVQKQNVETSLIYPNPTKDVVTISNAQGKTLRIVDIQGKEVYNQKVNTSSMEVSMKSLGAKGMYLLHILDANNESIQTKQIVLE